MKTINDEHYHEYHDCNAHIHLDNVNNYLIHNMSMSMRLKKLWSQYDVEDGDDDENGVRTEYLRNGFI